MESGKEVTFDPRLQGPLTCLITEPRECGKIQLVSEIKGEKNDLINPPIKSITYCYSQRQEIFSKYKDKVKRQRQTMSTLFSWCDESVSRGRKTGMRGRGTGTQERRDEPSERRNGKRETLWTRPNRVLGPGNEYPPSVDMAGTSDPLSRCVIIGD